MVSQSAHLQAIDGPSVWLPGIVACIARFLSANEIACTLRLVDKSTSQQFATYTTVRLSLPSPTHIFKQRWGRPDVFRAYTLRQRKDLLCLTAASGSIANLEIALANAGILITSVVLEAAAEAGQLVVCEMLRERGCPWGDCESVTAAGRGGHRRVCEWMLASGCPLVSTAVYAAARGGHEDLMHWLLQLPRQRSVAEALNVVILLCEAARGLSLVALQRLHQQLMAGQQQGGEAQQQQQQPQEVLSEEQQGAILAAAATSSTPDWRAKVEWLEGQGYPRTPRACSFAASFLPDEEAVSRLQWLHSRGYTPDGDTTAAAVSHGNLAALRFLMDQAGVPDIEQCTDYEIARRGHLAALQYLHANGFPLEPEEVAQGAAQMAHLPVLAWAVEVLELQQRTWSTTQRAYVFNQAATSGSIEVLSWLRERGWTWGRGTISCAAESGCEAAVEWLVEQGCPLPVDGAAFTTAATQGDLAMIRCLLRLGCPWGPNQLEGCIRRFVAVPALRCLLELGCPVDWDAVVTAVEQQWQREYCTALLTWLGEERQRWPLGAQQSQQGQQQP